ncbi:MAG TPA: YceD family protein [Acidimicrobiales bacterium]|nr:YceD family protein [Acidimicrobiales bacterium]
MSPAKPLQVGVADLLANPGTLLRFETEAVLEGLATSVARVPEGGVVSVALTLEAIGGGALTATGTVSAPWSAPCRRCLEPVEGSAEVDVREVFEPRPTEGETYLLQGEQVDLEPMVRDAVLLAMPLAPLCSEVCPGPAPDAFPTGPRSEADRASDPRWAALSELEFDE